MARLAHPNILRLLGYCNDVNPETGEQEQILLYELMGGGSLKQLMEAEGQVSMVELMGILLGAARGLQYLHSFNLVHR